MPSKYRICIAAVSAMLAGGSAQADRLLGFNIGEAVFYKLDTDDGEIIKFPGHPATGLGGLDIDSAGNLYYQDEDTLWLIDLDQPSNDVFINLTSGATFESFEIIDDVGYTSDVFTGVWYAIDLGTASRARSATWDAASTG